MSAVSQPGASSQNIHGGRCEKCLKPKLFAANRTRLPHITGAHGLRYRALNTCSLGVELPQLRRFLTNASQIEGMIARFIWTQNQHFGCHRSTLCMKRTRAAEPKGETNAKAGLSMPIGDMTPIPAEVSGRADHLVRLPIDLNLVGIKTSSFF